MSDPWSRSWTIFGVTHVHRVGRWRFGLGAAGHSTESRISTVSRMIGVVTNEEPQPRRQETTAIDGRLPADLLASIADEVKAEADQKPAPAADESG